MENGRWQQYSLYAVSISKRVILFTIPMTPIIIGNRDCKRKSLNTDMWKRECTQHNFQTVLHPYVHQTQEGWFQAQRLESKRLGKLEAKTVRCKVNKWYMQLFKWATFCRIYRFRLQNWGSQSHILRSRLWYFSFKVSSQM